MGVVGIEEGFRQRLYFHEFKELYGSCMKYKKWIVHEKKHSVTYRT